MRIMPPANLPPRSSRAAAAHGRRGQRRRRRICACCFKVITKPDSRAQPESSFLPCRIPTRDCPPRGFSCWGASWAGTHTLSRTCSPCGGCRQRLDACQSWCSHGARLLVAPSRPTLRSRVPRSAARGSVHSSQHLRSCPKMLLHCRRRFKPWCEARCRNTRRTVISNRGISSLRR